MLTATQVTRLISANETKTVSDLGGRGEGRLQLRVRSGVNGATAEWMLQWFHEGRKRRMKIGNAGTNGLGLKDARERFRELSAWVQDGLDPKQILEERRQEEKVKRAEEESRGTVKELFQAYVDDMKARGKSSWAQVENGLLSGKYAAVVDLGADTKAGMVTSKDVQSLLTKTHKRAQSTAAHLRSYLLSAFNFGIGHEFSYTRSKQDVSFNLQSNPVASIPRDQAAFKVGQRVLEPEEIKKIWHTMQDNGVDELTGLVFRLILTTGGQRVREVVEAPWSEFDLDGRVWRLPGARTKNGRDHHIPLSDRTVDLLETIRSEVEVDSPYLFPSPYDATRPIRFASLGRAATRFCEQTGMPKWNPRDIRRTCRTHLAESGVPGWKLDRHFNHGTTVGVGERHYDRSQAMNDKVEVMNRWDELLGRFIDGDGGGKVVYMVK